MPGTYCSVQGITTKTFLRLSLVKRLVIAHKSMGATLAARHSCDSVQYTPGSTTLPGILPSLLGTLSIGHNSHQNSRLWSGLLT